jgi:hypothetical protein
MMIGELQIEVLATFVKKEKTDTKLRLQIHIFVGSMKIKNIGGKEAYRAAPKDSSGFVFSFIALLIMALVHTDTLVLPSLT